MVVTQTVPAIAIAPLLVLWFGFGLSPKIILIVIVCFFPVAVGFLDGFASADPDEIKLLRSMGAGNKLDPTAFMVADIYETSVCPLAKVMRRELKRRGIGGLKVVYSREEALKPTETIAEGERRAIPGSTAFVPSVVGLIIASEVIKDLAGIK
mgnify:CR=1 FL=1